MLLRNKPYEKKQKHTMAKFLQNQIEKKQFFRGGIGELSLDRS